MGVYGRFERHHGPSMGECGADFWRDFEKLAEARRLQRRRCAGDGSASADQWPGAGEQRRSHRVLSCALRICGGLMTLRRDGAELRQTLFQGWGGEGRRACCAGGWVTIRFQKEVKHANLKNRF